MAINIEGSDQLLPNPLGDPNGIARVAQLFGENHKLVSSGPGQRAVAEGGLIVIARLRARDGIGAAQATHQAQGDLDQQGIAGVVSETVIDYFESIDVDEQERELEICMATRDGECPPKTIEEERAIGQVGQAIVEGIMRQRFLGALPFGDVAIYDDQSFGLAASVANDARGRFQDSPRDIRGVLRDR